MIPSDFSDYFNQCSGHEQQQVIEELLQLSVQSSEVIDTSEGKALSCPHCQSKSVGGNGRLKGAQHTAYGHPYRHCPNLKHRLVRVQTPTI